MVLPMRVSEDEEARSRLRGIYLSKGVFHSTVIAGKEAEGAKYKDYFDWKEPAAKAARAPRAG